MARSKIDLGEFLQDTTENKKAKFKTDVMEIPKKKTTKKDTCKAYTVWVEKNELARWRAYIETKGIKSEDLALYAIKHWINNIEPISAEETEKYAANLKKCRKDIGL